MKYILILISTITIIFANEYYSKAKPIWSYKISSEVSGKVIYSDDFSEGKFGTNIPIIKIFDTLDRLDLNSTYIEYANLKEMVSITTKLYKIDEKAYNKIKKLSTYSQTQKDAKLMKMLSSKTTFLNQKTNLAKLNLKIKTLEDRIDKKNIKVDSRYYVYKIYPHVGDFINFGSPLIEIQDLSKARLTIFVTKDDLEAIEDKIIYLDGEKTDYKVDKVIKVADSINISSYKVEIIIKKPKLFSQLVKIEFR